MIASILLTILFIIVCSALIFFLFAIFLPSLKEQNINAKNALFSDGEIAIETGHTNFAQVKTGMKAVILCSAERKFSEKRFNYKGQRDCTLFKSIYSTEYDCGWGCSGFGNCIYACPRQAISIVNGTAVVNNLCNGCGICVSVCPKQLIAIIPADQKKCVLCKAPESEKNGCSMCRKESTILITQKKTYLFWEKCCKLFNRI